MVGRDRELETLRGAVSDGGNATIVEGPAGIGKSRLVRELAAWARGRGGVVLVGRCSATSADTPLRPIREALLSAARAGIRPPESMRSFLPTLARVVPEWSTVSGADADPSTLVLGEGVLRLLHTLARPDRTGRAGRGGSAMGRCGVARGHRIPRGQHRRVRRRPRRDVADGRRHGGHVTREHARRPSGRGRHRAACHWTPSEVMTMAHDIVGQELPRNAAATLRARSEGVPFLIEELLAAAEPTGWSAIDDAMPGSVTSPVAARLATLPPEAVRLLQHAATLGRDFDWTVAARSDRRGREHRRGAAANLRAGTARRCRRVRLSLPPCPDPGCGAARRRSGRVEDRGRGGAGRTRRDRSRPRGRAMSRRGDVGELGPGNPGAPRASCSWRQHAPSTKVRWPPPRHWCAGRTSRVQPSTASRSTPCSCASRRSPARSTGHRCSACGCSNSADLTH